MLTEYDFLIVPSLFILFLIWLEVKKKSIDDDH